MFTLALLSLTVSTSAVELTARQDDAVFQRDIRQETTIFQLSTMVEQLTQKMSMMEAGTGPMLAATTGIAQDMAARTGDLLTTATANTVRIDQMEAAVSAQTASVNAAVNTLTTAVNTQLNTATTDLDSRIAAATLSISVQMRGFQTGINASSSTLASSLTASVSRSVAATTAGLAEMSSTMTAGITQMNTSMTRGLASKVGMAEVQPYMWVGGCTRHATSAWNDYCMNRAEVNLMGDKFRLASATRFVAIRNAYFWLSFTHIGNSCNWHYHLLYFNNQHVIHQNNGAWSGHWKDYQTFTTNRLNNGQTMYARVYNQCWTAYHSMSGGHSKIIARWMGNVERA